MRVEELTVLLVNEDSTSKFSKSRLTRSILTGAQIAFRICDQHRSGAWHGTGGVVVVLSFVCLWILWVGFDDGS